jgi:uncharacterized protein YutE (UPF0331/DUF86 family)
MTDAALVAKKLTLIESCVSDRRLGEPRTNRELFDLLHRDGWLEAALAGTLRNMAGFRNVLVHGYDDVDLAVVRDVLDHHISDLEVV